MGKVLRIRNWIKRPVDEPRGPATIIILPVIRIERHVAPPPAKKRCKKANS
jgi:hypothetical protein